MEQLSGFAEYVMGSSTVAKVAMCVALFVILGFLKALRKHLIGSLLLGLLVAAFCYFVLEVEQGTAELVFWGVFVVSFISLMKQASDVVDELIDES